MCCAGHALTTGLIGSRSVTVSPLAQVRLIRANRGPAPDETTASLTRRSGEGHQPGMRTDNGNATGEPVCTVNVIVSPNGYVVLSTIVTETPEPTDVVTVD